MGRKKVILEDFSYTASNLRDTDKTAGVIKTLVFNFRSHLIKFSSVAQSCLTLCERLVKGNGKKKSCLFNSRMLLVPVLDYHPKADWVIH